MSASIGHNSKVRHYLDKIEPLDLKKDDINDDIKEWFKAAKDDGIKPKILKRLIKKRKKTEDKKKQEEEEALELAQMEHEAGFDATPLGQAALRG